MKSKLIFLVLLIVCFSCGTNNKPVSDAQKEKIKGEVKEVVNTYFKAAEEANADMILETYLDSPDFVFTYNGNSFSYKQCADMSKSVFGTLENQKITVVDEKYAVLDNFTVMVTVNNKCLMNYKDGHSVLQDPWISQILLKKIDNKWKVISGAESGIEQSVKNSETSKELNQVELMKQWIGTWQGEMGKDTFAIVEYKSYGTAIENNIKIMTKAKIISTEKGLWGYDKENDKFINAEIWNYSPDISLYAIWFTSKNIGEGVSFKYLSNPQNAPSKTKAEFKSPDTFIMSNLRNDKIVAAWTFNRVKK